MWRRDWQGEVLERGNIWTFFSPFKPKAGEKRVRVQQGQSMEGRERVERVGGKWKSDGVGNEEIDDARRKDVPIDHICGAGGERLSWGIKE